MPISLEGSPLGMNFFEKLPNKNPIGHGVTPASGTEVDRVLIFHMYKLGELKLLMAILMYAKCMLTIWHVYGKCMVTLWYVYGAVW